MSEQALSEAVEEFDPMEVEIDPDTGEIIETQKFEYNDLPRVGEKVNYLQEQFDYLMSDNHPINLYIDKLVTRRGQQMARLSKEIGYFKSVAQVYVDQAEGRKIVLAGIGRFRYRKGSEVVDTNTYDAMTPRERLVVQIDRPDLFVIKNTFSVNKTAIKAAAKNSMPETMFPVVRKPDTFEFKGE